MMVRGVWRRSVSAMGAPSTRGTTELLVADKWRREAATGPAANDGKAGLSVTLRSSGYYIPRRRSAQSFCTLFRADIFGVVCRVFNILENRNPQVFTK